MYTHTHTGGTYSSGKRKTTMMNFIVAVADKPQEGETEPKM
jgi:hypothetical protein